MTTRLKALRCALSDRIGRRPVYMGGAVFCALLAFPYFWLLNSGSTGLIWLAIVLSLPIGHAAMYAPQASFLSELFGTSVRYSGASIGYQLAPVFGGGVAPFIATLLLARSGGDYWPIALYMIAMAAITVVSVFIAVETSRIDVHDETPPRSTPPKNLPEGWAGRLTGDTPDGLRAPAFADPEDHGSPTRGAARIPRTVFVTDPGSVAPAPRKPLDGSG